jgi:hypothetical protein
MKEGMRMVYGPTPIDTSRINLADDLLELRERLAENAHDVWASRRLSEGWTYGPARDDATKKHPDLVPYADLPDTVMGLAAVHGIDRSIDDTPARTSRHIFSNSSSAERICCSCLASLAAASKHAAYGVSASNP